jgi:hypothetical protein
MQKKKNLNYWFHKSLKLGLFQKLLIYSYNYFFDCTNITKNEIGQIKVQNIKIPAEVPKICIIWSRALRKRKTSTNNNKSWTKHPKNNKKTPKITRHLEEKKDQPYEKENNKRDKKTL